MKHIPAPFVRHLAFAFFALALLAIQAMIGGVRLVFSLPAYGLLACGALLSVLAFKKLSRPNLACAVSALVLTAWVVVRALSSPVEYLARMDLMMILGAILVYLCTWMQLASTRLRLTLVWVLIGFGLVHVAIGAIQFKQGDDFMLLPGIMRPSYAWRASGFYICPNHLSGLLEMLAMLALGLACWGNIRPTLRILALYCGLMCIAGIAITGSRGGYLSLVFGLCVFAALSLWAMKLSRSGGFWLMFAGFGASAAVILGGAFFFMSQSESIHARMLQIYDPTNMRPLLWQAAMKQFHLQPITGTGSGTYLFYGRQFRSYFVQNDPMHAHNDYLELIAEYGLIGAILCGVFVVVHLVSGLVGLRRIVREQIHPETPRLSHDLALVIGAWSALATLLAHSLADFNMHIPANALLMAFLLGLLAKPTSEPDCENVQLAQSAGWWPWLGAAVAIVLLGLSIRLLPGEVFAERARVALRDDRNADALSLAKRGIAWEKRNPFLYAYLGEAEHFMTLVTSDAVESRVLQEDAAADYETAIKLFPCDTGLLLKQAQIYDILGEFPMAEDDFQRLLKCDPLLGNVYAYYGLHWQLQRRIPAAELCFRIARRLGESEISPKGLENLERVKADPMGQALAAHFPEVPSNLPAAWILNTP